MGRVPIHVYSDEPWVPYERLFRQRLGYVTTVDDLPGLLRRLNNASRRAATHAEVTRRERSAMRLRRSHFTLGGVLEQLARFMQDPQRSDLQCRTLPRTVRDA